MNLFYNFTLLIRKIEFVMNVTIILIVRLIRCLVSVFWDYCKQIYFYLFTPKRNPRKSLWKWLKSHFQKYSKLNNTKTLHLLLAFIVVLYHVKTSLQKLQTVKRNLWIDSGSDMVSAWPPFRGFTSSPGSFSVFKMQRPRETTLT